jgi:hypothetical protein
MKKEERLLLEAVKLRIELQNQFNNGVDSKSKEYVENCKKMNFLLMEWAKYYVIRFIKDKDEKDTIKHREIYKELLEKNIPNGEGYELIRKHNHELYEVVLKKEKELKGE